MSTKRTYHPAKTRKSKTHGFRKRMDSHDGRKVIKRRQSKGRRRLTT